MLTFKEALCLLAIVVAYGITGRMDYEDALLMEQVRQQVGADCGPRPGAERICSSAAPTAPLPPGLVPFPPMSPRSDADTDHRARARH